VSFAAITLCVASQRVFVVLFVIHSVRKLLDTPSYTTGLAEETEGNHERKVAYIPSVIFVLTNTNVLIYSVSVATDEFSLASCQGGSRTNPDNLTRGGEQSRSVRCSPSVSDLFLNFFNRKAIYKIPLASLFKK